MTALPLWVDLLMAGLYLVIFGGTPQIVQDLNRLRSLASDRSFYDAAGRVLLELNIRRVTALVVGLVFIGMYFAGISLNAGVAVILGLFGVYMIWQVRSARIFAMEVGQAVSSIAYLEEIDREAPEGDPTGWQGLLIEKARASPPLRQKLAQVMWLDSHLMSAIHARPDREFPEARQARDLCIEIACDLGIPEREGADWISHYASSIGRQLNIAPARPLPR